MPTPMYVFQSHFLFLLGFRAKLNAIFASKAYCVTEVKACSVFSNAKDKVLYKITAYADFFGLYLKNDQKGSLVCNN